jgi:ABC-type nitrate/sulfonate/bicarbonate transport system substrate-binding protein
MRIRPAPRGHGLAIPILGMVCLLLACSPGPAASSARQPQAAAAQPAAASGAATSTTPLRTVRSGYTTIAASSLPWWVALDGDYFREQGLDVTLIHVDAGAPLLAALNSNELDLVNAGGPSLVLGNLQGMETMIVGASSAVLDSSVFVRPEIQTVEDLRGKTVGVTNLKAITDTAARLGLERSGLQPDVDVFTRRTGGLAESMAGLETGAIDGASMSVPMVFEARKRGYRELINVTALAIPFVNAAVGATRKTLAERPELVGPYLRALAQAASRIKTDREYAMQVVAKYTQVEDPETLGATVDFYRPLVRVDLYPEALAVQTILDVEEHPAARTARLEDVADVRFAEQIRASGFLDGLAK